MDVAPVRVTSVMGYSCLNKVVDPVIFRQKPTSRYRARITPSPPLARSALPRERFRSLAHCRPASTLRHVRSWRKLPCERLTKGRVLTVRPEGANHQWRKIPPGELSIDPVADERLGRVTGRAGAS